MEKTLEQIKVQIVETRTSLLLAVLKEIIKRGASVDPTIIEEFLITKVGAIA